MSANTYLIDRLTRHQIFQQRFGGGQVNDLMPILERMSQDIRARLLGATTDFQVGRLQLLLSEIEDLVIEAGGELEQQLTLGLTDFSQYEAEFNQRLLSEVVDVDIVLPSPEQLAAAVTNSRARIVQGKRVLRMTVPELVRQFTQAKRDQVLDAIRAGFIEGQTQQQMVRRVSDITDKAAKRQAGAMIRTAVNHMGTEARKQTYQANADVLDGEEWTSVLDGNTTLGCMALDGEIFPVGEGLYPPRHFGCRSIRVPKVKSQFSLFRGKGERASMEGPVSANLTYSGFLRRQPKEFQDEVLGPERARLFREGKVTLDGFVDEVGRTLTLDQLRAREGLTLQ